MVEENPMVWTLTLCCGLVEAAVLLTYECYYELW